MNFKTYAIATFIAACSLTVGMGCCGKKSSSARNLITRLVKKAQQEEANSSASKSDETTATADPATSFEADPTGASDPGPSPVKQKILDKLNAAKLVPASPPQTHRLGKTATTSIVLLEQQTVITILEYDSLATALAMSKNMAKALSRHDDSVFWRDGRAIVTVHCTDKDHRNCVKVQNILKD